MFEGWSDFHLLLGTAAGALIGLLFVVARLNPGVERAKLARGQSTYMTPNVFDLAVVLVVSAVALTPRLPAAMAGATVSLCALGGLAHGVAVCLRLHRLRAQASAPHWSDFWLYGAAAAAIHLGLIASGALIAAGEAPAAYGLAASALLLMLLAIRNAWDLVTTIAQNARG